VVGEEGILSREELNYWLDPQSMTAPVRAVKKKR